MQHLEWRRAGGNMPLSRASDPTMLLWLRHRDTATKPSVGSLLASGRCAAAGRDRVARDLRADLNR